MAVKKEDPVNILMVDDQPAKLMSYEVILSELGENLLMAQSGRDALQLLLKTDVAIVLVDVCMPDLDGFELAQMIREHPRFQQTAIIFVSAVHLSEIDFVRGYASGAVDYISVPVVPDLLRAKVRVFAELYRKTKQLERLNAELELRVADRTAELQESVKQIEESDRRRRLALAAGRMGSWEWDFLNGKFVWDEGQYRIFGMSPDSFEPTSDSVLSLIHPEDRSFIRGLAQSSLQDGQPYNGEFRILRPDGQVSWCETAGAPSWDREGKTIRLSGVTVDITERKRAEQILHDANEELELRIAERTKEREQALAQLFEAQKMETIGKLTGGVAHDFNNLLMAVLGSLELIGKRVPEEPRLQRLIDNAVQGAERGVALTQRLLAFARRQDLKPEVIGAADLVKGMEGLVQRAAGPSIRIRFDLPDDLAAVRVDVNQVELALLNLSVNARDAMPDGGLLTISARNERVDSDSALPSGEYVRISVADTGVGMDAETAARATDPFFTTKGPGKGTGLGLSMVHGIVMQSGGRLRITSQIGFGTTVDLWLPKSDGAPSARPAQTTKKGSQVKPCTVLLVDDDGLVRTGAAAMLEDLGHSTLEACSGREALAIFRSNPSIDLVLTDQAMPEMTGLELMQLIRAEQPNFPIILATGYAESPEIAIKEGFRRLSKPFRQAELAQAIAAVLRTGGSRRRVLESTRS